MSKSGSFARSCSKRVDHPFIAQDEADKWDDQVTAIRVDACRPLNRGEVKRLCQDFRQDYLPNLEHDSATTANKNLAVHLESNQPALQNECARQMAYTDRTESVLLSPVFRR